MYDSDASALLPIDFSQECRTITTLTTLRIFVNRIVRIETRIKLMFGSKSILCDSLGFPKEIERSLYRFYSFADNQL